ncbi:MAG TPA: PH domain-containing protein [Candidatus Saccharimonadales bacterium]|nr:PH domain-containing protein [Candidatus Saccharimonadales bacterium]
MVHADEINKQLRGLGVNFQFWCRAEVRELPKILFDGEQLNHVLIGRYEGGFALFCATDRRVLLIDKKPFYLTLEDIRYDMISDVQYNHRLIDATVRLGTLNKTIAFTGYNHNKLRNFTSYIQEQVMYYRQQQNASQMQPIPLLRPNPINQALAATPASQQQVMNPYKMPVIVRRRVSRFY